MAPSLIALFFPSPRQARKTLQRIGGGDTLDDSSAPKVPPIHDISFIPLQGSLGARGAPLYYNSNIGMSAQSWRIVSEWSTEEGCYSPRLLSDHQRLETGFPTMTMEITMSAALETGQAWRQQASCPPGRPHHRRADLWAPSFQCLSENSKEKKKTTRSGATEAASHCSPLAGRVCNLMRW